MSEVQQQSYSAVKAPFSRCFALLQAAERNFQLAKFGVQQLSAMDAAELPTSLYPRVYSVYPGLQADSQMPPNYTREQLKLEVDKEMAEGFPLLSASAATAFWTVLEDLAREFLTYWVIAHPAKATLHKPGRILSISRGSLLNFEANRDNLAWEICLDIMKEAEAKSAVERYDACQAMLGLTLPKAENPLLSILTELEAVRHIIVHRNSVVDEQFKRRCRSPIDVPEEIGDVLHVNSTRLERYRNAVYDYVDIMMQRVRQAVPEVVNF